MSDWSADVCSSDLVPAVDQPYPLAFRPTIEKTQAVHNPGLCASAAWKPSPGPVRHAPQRGGKVESKRLFPDAVTMPDQSSEKPAPNQPGAQQPEDFKQTALDYHRLAPAGKIKVTATKPMVPQRELALAYSPGVAYASIGRASCRERVGPYG